MAEDYAGFHHRAVRAARLLHDKKHRLERRCFLIEGPLLVEAALAAGAMLEQVFVLDDEDANKFAPLHFGRDEEANTFAPLHFGGSVLRVDRRTLESLSTTKTPQGIVAVAAFLHHPIDALERFAPPAGAVLMLVLPNLSDPGNAGTLVRSAEAFGASAICFGPQAVEPYNDKVVRASMGSLFRVAILRYESWPALLAATRAARISLLGSDPGGKDVRTVTLPERAALVVGQERHGLAGIAHGDIDLVIAIPQRNGVESLNAGVAGSLLLYELSRAHRFLGLHRAGTSDA